MGEMVDNGGYGNGAFVALGVCGQKQDRLVADRNRYRERSRGKSEVTY